MHPTSSHLTRSYPTGSPFGAVRAENLSLTAIRGVASMWVVYHHFVTGVTGYRSVLADFGFVAVDLFFILSGLILAEVYQSLSAGGVGRFLAKRTCRIYPLHVACLLGLAVTADWPRWHTRLAATHWPGRVALLLLLVAALVAIVRLIRFGASGARVSATLLLGIGLALGLGVALHLHWTWRLAGSFLLLQAFFRLDTMANPPAWSAGVEQALYFFFPLAIAVLRRRWPGAVLLFACAALLAAEHAVQARYAGATDGVGAVLRGVAGFLLGMLLWRLGEWRPIGRRQATVEQGCGLLGIAAGVWLAWPFPVVVGSAILLHGLGRDTGLLAVLLRAGPLVWLGRISFSIYLVHYPLYLGAEHLLPPSWFSGAALSWVRLQLIVALVLGVSTLTWWLIEEPGRRLPSTLPSLLRALRASARRRLRLRVVW